MALSAASTFEVRTAGNDTNGGGFVTGAAGTDYSQQDTKNTAGNDISTTDAVGNGTTTLTSATANFGTTIVGNIIYLQGGTGVLAASRYQVTARASTTSITLDRAVATGTGITMNIGGAVASLGILGSTTATILVDNNRIFIKAGTYTITSASNNVSAGCFSKTTTLYIEGYQTIRGDLGTPPLLQADGVITTFSILQLSGTTGTIKNINVNGNNRTSSRGFLLGNTAIVYKCKASNCTNGGFFSSGGQAYLIQCVATGCSATPAINGVNCFACIAYNNTFTGFSTANTINFFSRCISYNNSGATSDGFAYSGTTGQYLNCVTYNNGRHGFSLNGSNISCINCIAEDNTDTGFLNTGGTRQNQQYINCAVYSNGTDFSIGTSPFNINQGSITGSGSFFTNAAAGDFSLNSTSGRGAALKAVGIPGIFPEGLTTSYLDIGAAQHQDSGGGSGGEHSSVF